MVYNLYMQFQVLLMTEGQHNSVMELVVIKRAAQLRESRGLVQGQLVCSLKYTLFGNYYTEQFVHDPRGQSRK